MMRWGIASAFISEKGMSVVVHFADTNTIMKCVFFLIIVVLFLRQSDTQPSMFEKTKYVTGLQSRQRHVKLFVIVVLNYYYTIKLYLTHLNNMIIIWYIFSNVFIIGSINHINAVVSICWRNLRTCI